MKIVWLWDYKNDFLTFIKMYNHTIVFSQVMYMAEFCSNSYLCVLKHAAKKVESPAYLLSSLFLDNVFKSYAKTRNNIYDLGLNIVQSQAVMGNLDF